MGGVYLHNFLCSIFVCEISGFHHGVVEAFALLGCYAAYVGSWLLTFEDNLGH
jgi:hypothetical protein